MNMVPPPQAALANSNGWAISAQLPGCAYCPILWLGRHLMALGTLAGSIAISFECSLRVDTNMRQVHSPWFSSCTRPANLANGLANSPYRIWSRLIFSLKCCLHDRRAMILPLPVTLNRLAAACTGSHARL